MSYINEIKRKIRKPEIRAYMRKGVYTTVALLTITGLYQIKSVKEDVNYAADFAKFYFFCPGVNHEFKKGETIDGLLYREGFKKNEIRAARDALIFRNYVLDSLANKPINPDKIRAGDVIEGFDKNRNNKFG